MTTADEQHPEPGAALAEKPELLFRNVRDQFYVNGRVSSQVFEPAPADKGLLSVDRSSLTSAKAAFELFLSRKFSNSAGILAVSVEECIAQNVPALENPLKDNVAHAVVDFRSHNNNQTKRRAGRLRDIAVNRGWHHGPNNK